MTERKEALPRTAILRRDGRFAGKLAFVAGATSGIGRATALAFGREGARARAIVVADAAAEGNRGNP